MAEQAAKRPKLGVVAAARSSDAGGAVSLPNMEMISDKNKAMENVVSQSLKSTPAVVSDSHKYRQQIRPLAPVGSPFSMNRYKLDNRPTTFRVLPPLPAGFADVSLFLTYFLFLQFVLHCLYKS